MKPSVGFSIQFRIKRGTPREPRTRTKYTYDSFGNLLASSGTLVNNFRYTGREFDTETNLYFYRARYYDPNTGRFISEDSLREPMRGLNFYKYVRDNPARLIDPDGQTDLPFVRYQ